MIPDKISKLLYSNNEADVRVGVELAKYFLKIEEIEDIIWERLMAEHVYPLDGPQWLQEICTELYKL